MNNPSETTTAPLPFDGMKAADQITMFLMNNPGKQFTSYDIAEALNMPRGTASSAVGQLHAERMRSDDPDPAGVYGFKPAADGRGHPTMVTYAYRTDRPFDSTLRPIKATAYRTHAEVAELIDGVAVDAALAAIDDVLGTDHASRPRTAPAAAPVAAPANPMPSLTLEPTPIDGVWITNHGELVRLVVVEIVDA